MLDGFYQPTVETEKVEIKSNYHTHTHLCGHAGGSVRDYAAAAADAGLEVLGMSDHFTSPAAAYAQYIDFKTLATEYLPEIRAAREEFGDRIKILSAAEIEYFDGYIEYYKRLLENLDYLVMGQHEYIYDGVHYNSFADGLDDDSVVAYFKSVDRGLKAGFFSVLAHPDLIFYRSPKITKKITAAFDNTVKTAVGEGVALELNANGIRSHGFRYPTDLFVELCKKHNARVVVSSDCHSPNVLCDEHMLRLYGYARKFGLNVVDEIDINTPKK